MRIRETAGCIPCLMLVAATLLTGRDGFAQIAGSANFTLEASAFSTAGGAAASETFSVFATVGDSSPVGDAASLNYAANTGLLGTAETIPTDELMPGRVIVIKTETLARFVARSDDGPLFELPDGRTHPGGGATLHIVDIDGAAEVAFDLPAQGPPFGWTGLGNPPGVKGFKYKGAGTTADPCRVVVIKRNGVTAVCKGTGVTLPVPYAGDRGVILEVGPASKRYCGVYGGTASGNPAQVYKRRRASAPGACPDLQ